MNSSVQLYLFKTSSKVKQRGMIRTSWLVKIAFIIFSTVCSGSSIGNKQENLGEKGTRVAWELMRVEKREFVWEFSQLFCPGQTRTRVAWELMRVEKREFVWEFSQLLCPGQTRTRDAWELTNDSLYQSFPNSHVLVKREQELHGYCNSQQLSPSLLDIFKMLSWPDNT